MTKLEKIKQAAREFRLAQKAFRDAQLADLTKRTAELGVAWERVLKAIEATK